MQASPEDEEIVPQDLPTGIGQALLVVFTCGGRVGIRLSLALQGALGALDHGEDKSVFQNAEPEFATKVYYRIFVSTLAPSGLCPRELIHSQSSGRGTKGSNTPSTPNRRKKGTSPASRSCSTSRRSPRSSSRSVSLSTHSLPDALNTFYRTTRTS